MSIVRDQNSLTIHGEPPQGSQEVIRSRRPFFVALLFAILGSTSPAFAHKDDYLDETLVFLTLERGEIEPEYWLDLVRNPTGGDSLRNTVALEYGISDHTMIDGRLTRAGGEGGAMAEGRVEVRHRFSDEGTRPVDVAVSAEVNSQRAENGTRETGVEPRLILSKDFLAGKANATLNLAEEVATGETRSSFNPAFGIRYDPSERIRLGAELHYQGSGGSSSVIPQVAFSLPHDLTVRLGVSMDLAGGNRQEGDFARIAVEWEF
ncbi:MAG: hypothetical protein ABI718_03740 [Acidobacteriota bacterium]